MELPPGLPLQQAVEQLRSLAEQHLPADIGLIFLGEALTFEETAREVTLTYVLAFVIVLLVLAAQFESVNSAVVVMTTVPFGIAAAIFALFLTGTSINIYSQIGLVMLIGLLAKNAILLVEFADQLRDQGYEVRQAVEQAAAIRLRPIAMTLLSTLLGALPLILSSGAGAEARNQIGMVIVGGMSFGTILTLFVVPTAYTLLAGFGVIVVSGLFGWLAARALGIAPRTLVPPMMFNNCGNLGLPLAVLAFGDAALAPAVVLFVLSNLLHFSFGAWLLDPRTSWLTAWQSPSVLATGAGSVIFSHVNDGGFWLIKEYFNMTVAQTFKTWTVLETLISLVAFALTVGLSYLL